MKFLWDIWPFILSFKKSARSSFQLQFLNQLQLDRCSSSSGPPHLPRITYRHHFRLHYLENALLSADWNHACASEAPLNSEPSSHSWCCPYVLFFKETLSCCRARFSFTHCPSCRPGDMMGSMEVLASKAYFISIFSNATDWPVFSLLLFSVMLRTP